MSIEIREANLAESADAEALLEVLESYARDVMGGAAALPAHVRERLVPALREQTNALVLLASRGARVVGLANCFYGFSTFAARPLLNVHDLAVLPEYRGQGVGRALLQAAEERAKKRGCAKLTLEVREDNAPARHLYHQHGFRDFELPGGSFRTFFLSKSLA